MHDWTTVEMEYKRYYKQENDYETNIRPYEILLNENETLKRHNAILLKECERLKNIIFHQENSCLLTLQQMRLAIAAQESQLQASKSSFFPIQSNGFLADPEYCEFQKGPGLDEDVYSDIITTIAKEATHDRKGKRNSFASEKCVSEAEGLEQVDIDKLVNSTVSETRVPELPPRTKRMSSLGSKYSKSIADIASTSNDGEPRNNNSVIKRLQWKKILQKSFSNSSSK